MMGKTGLHFTGCGSAFNPAMENTSAWFRQGKDFLLLDCGETVFSHVWRLPEFVDADRVLVLITHLHCDHVGSLGTLLSYCHYILDKKVELYYPSRQLEEYLHIVGIEPELYTHHMVVPQDWNLSVQAFPVEHAKEMDCFGFVIHGDGLSFYYSGDAHDIPSKVLKGFLCGDIEDMYHDTIMEPSEHHCPFSTLEAKIPKEYRQRVYCMHLQSFDCVPVIEQAGFNVVKVDSDNKRIRTV